MKTIICGGRNYSLTDGDRRWLDSLHVSLPITQVFSGGAKGADAGGEQWAKLRNIPVVSHPARWFDFRAPGAVIRRRLDGSQYNVIAGHQRNQQMADYADVCVAFPGGSGTADMIERARAKGLRVIISPGRLSEQP